VDSESNLARSAGTIQLCKVWSADPAMQSEIEKARKVRSETLDLMAHEDSSAVQTEDAKFGTTQGFIIDPTVVAETEETPGKHQRS
jgi:hypothetical protein